MPLAINISLDPAQITRIKKKLRERPELLRKQVAGALTDTAKHSKSFISKSIREQVNIKKQDIDKYISVQSAWDKKLTATVTLKKTDRIPLKYFGAKQTDRGVLYQISKTSKGPDGKPRKSVIPEGFGPKIAKLGGHVYKRKENPATGKQYPRLPLTQKLMGPSAWGVFVETGMRRPTRADAKRYLANRIRHRIQYQVK